MGLLRTLIGALRASDTEEKKRSLATLLVTELRLYTEDPLEETVAGPRLRSEVTRELVRAYEIYSKESGTTAEDAAIFREAAAEALCGGDVEIIAAALEGTDAGPPPPLAPK